MKLVKLWGKFLYSNAPNLQQFAVQQKDCSCYLPPAMHSEATIISGDGPEVTLREMGNLCWGLYVSVDLSLRVLIFLPSCLNEVSAWALARTLTIKAKEVSAQRLSSSYRTAQLWSETSDTVPAICRSHSSSSGVIAPNAINTFFLQYFWMFWCSSFLMLFFLPWSQPLHHHLLQPFVVPASIS